MPVWGSMWFQNGVSPVMEQLVFFHDHMMSIMMLVILVVGYFLLVSVFMNCYSFMMKGGQELESIWTIVPMLVLFMVAFPSLHLLYLMEEVDGSDLIIKVTGYQWYWNYDMGAVVDEVFDSYMIKGVSESGVLNNRLLCVDNCLYLPFFVSLGLLITAGDVIHSWTIPSLGVKADAIPGRLNQVLLFINRSGLFCGQCSEICGANHSFMPIIFSSISQVDFVKMFD